MIISDVKVCVDECLDYMKEIVELHFKRLEEGPTLPVALVVARDGGDEQNMVLKRWAINPLCMYPGVRDIPPCVFWEIVDECIEQTGGVAVVSGMIVDGVPRITVEQHGEYLTFDRKYDIWERNPEAPGRRSLPTIPPTELN